MKITVQSITINPVKHQITVNFYDELAHYHQSCDVTVFIDVSAGQTLDDLQNESIQAAKAFLAECLSVRPVTDSH